MLFCRRYHEDTISYSRCLEQMLVSSIPFGCYQEIGKSLPKIPATHSLVTGRSMLFTNGSSLRPVRLEGRGRSFARLPLPSNLLGRSMKIHILVLEACGRGGARSAPRPSFKYKNMNLHYPGHTARPCTWGRRSVPSLPQVGRAVCSGYWRFILVTSWTQVLTSKSCYR